MSYFKILKELRRIIQKIIDKIEYIERPYWMIVGWLLVGWFKGGF